MDNSNSQIKVVNNVEYYQNGNIKAYTSSLHHVDLNKTVNVRNKDYEIYSSRFDSAYRLLELEWDILCINNFIEIFLDNSTKFHILSYNSESFNFENFISSKIKEIDYEIPEPEYKKEISVPQKPMKEDFRYSLIPRWYHKIFKFIEKNDKSKLNSLYNYDLEQYIIAFNKCEKIRKENTDKKKNYEKKVKEKEKIFYGIKKMNHVLYNNYKFSINKKDIIIYFKTLLNNYLEINKIFKKINFEIDFDCEDGTLIVNFVFPEETEFPKNKEVKIIKTKISYKEISFTQKEFNELMKSTFYSLYLGIINEIIKFDTHNKIKNIVLNGFYKGIDKRTGKPFNVCIMTSKIFTSDFEEINLDNIEPKETFKYLSGRGVPDPDNIVKVEPIRFFNKSEYRLIDSDEVLSSLSSETNLAAVSWQDFETLIKDVFELEFKEQNIEIRNTQHSNDGGIDVVAFNSTPYSEGVILLQAKRYTNTVSPEPVRALKGAMDQHKAVRGILVTTSDFGGSSREFAQNHNITLINGDHLLELLKKHGYDFHIDLKQAKILNQK
jgi:restriction system protein